MSPPIVMMPRVAAWEADGGRSVNLAELYSITLGRTSLVPVQSKSLRSQALYLVTKCIHVIGALRAFGLWCIGAAQFFQRFLDGEFGCFGHGVPHIQAKRVRAINKQERRLPGRIDAAA
jgi:hypothetical protein